MQTARTELGFDRRPLESDADVHARLNWLIAANEYDCEQSRLFKNAREEVEMRLMRRPLSTERAYALFGMLLGLLPPAAIFIRLFGYGLGTWRVDLSSSSLLFLLCLAMNVACCLAGKYMGAKVSRKLRGLEKSEGASWILLPFEWLVIGAMWGAATGALGGSVFFVFGAIAGALFAVPVGIVAFLLFAPLHRALARGGMIDARHFWPLACGVVLLITALTLSPHVFSY